MSILRDPRAFNFLIMALYACAAIRWAIVGRWADTGYWVGAILLTACLTLKGA